MFIRIDHFAANMLNGLLATYLVMTIGSRYLSDDHTHVVVLKGASRISEVV